MPGKPFFGMHGDGVLEAAAGALHLTPQQLMQKLSDGKTTIADVAKQQGVDVNTVIDAMVNADRSRITDFVNNPLPLKLFGPGGNPAGNTRPIGPKFGFGIVGAGLDSAAHALGITTDELKSDLAKGMSIADIAKSKNLDVNKVIDELVADATAKIDAAVKSGMLSQDRANTLKAAIRSAITAFVNSDLPKPPAGNGGGGFGFFFGGHHGSGRFGYPGSAPGSSAPTSTTTTVKPATS
jgi:hypothetical protein